MSRLKKIAEVQELNGLDMPSNVLNNILQTKDASDTVNSVVFRKLMNQNTKFVVEIWELSGDKYVVFSGNFSGQWNASNIEMSRVFDNLNEAQLYVQEELQSEAELHEVIVGKRLNNFRKLIANGGEPNYKQIAKDFQSEVNIPDVEMKHKNHLNKYYEEFQNYMKKYYPEWANYPAYIWRGWNYFTNNVTPEKEEPEKEDETNVENQESKTTNETPSPVDTSGPADGSVGAVTDGGNSN